VSDAQGSETVEHDFEEILRRGPTPEEQAMIERYLLENRPPELVDAMQTDPEVMAEVVRLADEASDAGDAATGAAAAPKRRGDAGKTPEQIEAARLARVERKRQRRLEERRERFDQLLTELTSYVCFVGYSRSGGSIVAALMDAHRQLSVAHELDVFEKDDDGVRYNRLRFADRDELLDKTIDASARFADRRRGQRVREDGSRYYSDYRVEGGWQGRFEEPRAIGTKNAVEAAMIADKFGAEPFHALSEQATLPLRFVHVVRNPYDNIATMKRIHGDKAVGRYGRRIKGVVTVKEAGFPVLDVHLDDVIDDPRRELARICEFYGVEADAAYLDACAAVVADQPSRTGKEVDWSKSDLGAIRTLIDENDWLSRYAEAATRSGRRRS
jgi:hypothetical protein